jgi:hypothetical protein
MFGAIIRQALSLLLRMISLLLAFRYSFGVDINLINPLIVGHSLF